MLNFATKLAPESDKLDQAQEAGFRCAEFWLCEDHLADVDPILEMAALRDMRFVPHFPNKGLLSQDQLANAVRLYRELGCRAMVIHKPMLRSYGNRLFELEPDLRVAVENGRQRGDDFAAWAGDHEGLTLDIEHVWKFTLRDCPLEELLLFVRDFFAQHGRKVRHIHLPGYVPGSEEHHPAYRSPDLVTAMWDFLASIRFDGLIVSELNCEFQTPEHLSRDWALFREWQESRREIDEPVASAIA